MSTASDAPSGAKSTQSAPPDSPSGIVRTGSPVAASHRMASAPLPAASAVARSFLSLDAARQVMAPPWPCSAACVCAARSYTSAVCAAAYATRWPGRLARPPAGSEGDRPNVQLRDNGAEGASAEAMAVP